jgi:hypothetical protein
MALVPGFLDRLKIVLGSSGPAFLTACIGAQLFFGADHDELLLQRLANELYGCRTIGAFMMFIGLADFLAIKRTPAWPPARYRVYTSFVLLVFWGGAFTYIWANNSLRVPAIPFSFVAASLSIYAFWVARDGE